MSIERAQPIVIGINDETGELIWTNIEMPIWQKKMFPIRYSGDFSAFWQKLALLQKWDMESDAPNIAAFKSFVPDVDGKVYEKRRQHHKGD